MRIISEAKLREFCRLHPSAAAPVRAWRQNVKAAHWQNFDDLRGMYPRADRVGRCIVFDLGGNNFRLIAAIHFNRGIVYVRHLLTHAQYDREQWKDGCL